MKEIKKKNSPRAQTTHLTLFGLVILIVAPSELHCTFRISGSTYIS